MIFLFGYYCGTWYLAGWGPKGTAGLPGGTPLTQSRAVPGRPGKQRGCPASTSWTTVARYLHTFWYAYYGSHEVRAMIFSLNCWANYAASAQILSACGVL